MGVPLLEAHALWRAVGQNQDRVFSNISFSVEPGQVLFIRGPSGAGKTLLLRTLALLDPAEAGALRLRGQTPSELGIPAWRAEVLYVHQQRVDFPGTPAEFFSQLRNLASHRGRPCGELAPLVAAVGLDPSVVLQQQWKSLSGGQAQRVSLAIAVALRPSVLLVDEPTSACDPEAARLVEGVLRGCGAAVIWVTHDPGQPARVGGLQLELPSGAVGPVDGGAQPGGPGAGAQLQVAVGR